jgi:fructose-bisphosphate aldolase class II
MIMCAFSQGQIGNPTGADKPNKKFYDPRVWLRASEESAVVRLGVSSLDIHRLYLSRAYIEHVLSM